MQTFNVKCLAAIALFGAGILADSLGTYIHMKKEDQSLIELGRCILGTITGSILVAASIGCVTL